jgi:LysM repeat protein
LLVAWACTPASVTHVADPNEGAAQPVAVTQQETTPVAVQQSNVGDGEVSPRSEVTEQLDQELSPRETPVPAPHPLAGWTAREIADAVQKEPERLGSMSVGAPNGGALFNAVQLPDDPRWERMAPSHTWGTRETVDYITRAIATVHEQYPDSPRLHIGHISSRGGGHLSPHRSHQAGLDVDIGFYYRPESHRWYVRGTKETLDLQRTWALVRAFVTETDVRFILIDHSIQHLLREYASSIGEDENWLNDLFLGRGGNRPPLIRHAKGHATHLHVRFYNPIAEETGRRCYSALVSVGAIKPAQRFVDYKAKKGDTLLGLAKRFDTTVKAIKRVNGLRSNTILAKRIYKIPTVGHSVSQARGYELPPRRLPPNGSNAVSSAQPVRHVEDDSSQGCFSDGGGDCE